MKKEFNKIILAKLESRLFNENYNSVLGRGNVSSRIEMTKKGRTADFAARSLDNWETKRKQATGAPVHQV